MRAYLIIACLLLSASAAGAIECQSSPPPGDKNHWAWRLIDSKKCWYAGEPGMDKSKLRWAPGADRAPEPVQRIAPEMSQSAEPEPWSTFGIGLTVLASDIDWGARWPIVSSESSTNSTEVGGGVPGTENQGPRLSAGLVGMLTFVLLMLCTLAAWSFWSGQSHRMPPSRMTRPRTMRAPPLAPQPEPVQHGAQPRETSPYPPPIYVSRSARREQGSNSSRPIRQRAQQAY